MGLSSFMFSKFYFYKNTIFLAKKQRIFQNYCLVQKFGYYEIAFEKVWIDDEKAVKHLKTKKATLQRVAFVGDIRFELMTPWV